MLALNMKVTVKDGMIECPNVRMFWTQEDLRDEFAAQGRKVAVEDYDPFRQGGRRFGKPGDVVNLDSAFEQCKKCQVQVFYKKESTLKNNCLIYQDMKKRGRWRETKIRTKKPKTSNLDFVTGGISFDRGFDL